MAECTAVALVEVEEWHSTEVVPAGPWRQGHEWMARGACTAPGVDPAWFIVEEDAPDAAELIAKAKAVCRTCPVRLLCRIHADETGEFGVYAAETYTERTRRLRRWHRLALQLDHDQDLDLKHAQASLVAGKAAVA